MIIAIVSFFIIFIFFPDVSNKFFGVGIKDPEKVGQTITNAVDTVSDTVSDKVSDVIVDKVSESLN